MPIVSTKMMRIVSLSIITSLAMMQIIKRRSLRTNCRTFSMLVSVVEVQAIYDILAQQNRRRTFLRNIIGAGQNRCRPKLVQAKIGAGQNRRRPKSAQVKICVKRNQPTWLYLTLIKKNSCAKFNSFAFNGNSLHWEHDCIFALPLCSSVNHYYKQVISAQSQ